MDRVLIFSFSVILCSGSPSQQNESTTLGDDQFHPTEGVTTQHTLAHAIAITTPPDTLPPHLDPNSTFTTDSQKSDTVDLDTLWTIGDTTPDVLDQNSTLETTPTFDSSDRCDLCLAELTNLVDSLRDSKENITEICLNLANGDNVLVDCVMKNIRDCPDTNGTMLHELQYDLEEICRQACPSYRTFETEITQCWKTYLEMESLREKSDFTAFCSHVDTREKCISSITYNCSSEFVTADVIGQPLGHMTIDGLGEQEDTICSQGCLKRDDIFASASFCIKFINQTTTSRVLSGYLCLIESPCIFRDTGDNLCPREEDLVKVIYPNFRDTLKQFYKACSNHTFKKTAARVEGVQIATRNINVTEGVNVTIVRSNSSLNNYTEEHTNVTTTSLQTKLTTSIPSPLTTTIALVTPKQRKMGKAVTIKMWVPCNKVEKKLLVDSVRAAVKLYRGSVLVVFIGLTVGFILA